MISQTELKTLVPAMVAPCVLFYEAVTNKQVSQSTELSLTNGIVIGVSIVVALWGAWKNHQKEVHAKETNEVTPPKIPPDQSGVQNKVDTPIVTQEDLNKKLGG